MTKEVYVAIDTGHPVNAQMTRTQEARIEERLVKRIDKAIRKVYHDEAVIAVELLETKHCEWIFEGGMKIKTGLPGVVRVYDDQSWSHEGADGKPIARGSNFIQLGEYLVQSN